MFTLYGILNLIVFILSTSNRAQTFQKHISDDNLKVEALAGCRYGPYILLVSWNNVIKGKKVELPVSNVHMPSTVKTYL